MEIAPRLDELLRADGDAAAFVVDIAGLLSASFFSLGGSSAQPWIACDAVRFGLSWAEQSGRRHEWAQLLELRDGMIVDMQDYASGPKAVRALHRWRLSR